MLLTRSAVAAAVLWTTALSWLVLMPDQERVHRVLLALAITASTKAFVDRHAAQFREVVRLTLYAASYGQNSRVPAQGCSADDGEHPRG